MSHNNQEKDLLIFRLIVALEKYSIIKRQAPWQPWRSQSRSNNSNRINNMTTQTNKTTKNLNLERELLHSVIPWSGGWTSPYLQVGCRGWQGIPSPDPARRSRWTWGRSRNGQRSPDDSQQWPPSWWREQMPGSSLRQPTHWHWHRKKHQGCIKTACTV